MSNTLKLFKGLLITVALFFLLSLIGGTILKLTPFPEAKSTIYIMAVLSICAMFFGIYTGNIFKKKGLILGALAAIVFLGLVISGACAAFNIIFSKEILAAWYIMPIALGSVGGVLGTNLRN